MSNNELNIEELEKVNGGGFNFVETTNHPELGRGYWFCINYYFHGDNKKYENKQGGFTVEEARGSAMGHELLTLHSSNRGNIDFGIIEKGYNQ